MREKQGIDRDGIEGLKERKSEGGCWGNDVPVQGKEVAVVSLIDKGGERRRSFSKREA